VITLVLGGARSGKSAVAERLAGGLPGPVTYVATAAVDDADMAARVAAHRARRSSEWRTVEAGDRLTDSLIDVEGAVIVDALGTWVAAWPGFEADVEALCRAW